MRNLFTATLSEVELDDIKSFTDGLAENVSVEYKSQMSEKDVSEQVAKVACGMANSYGGIVFFGIQAKNNEKKQGVPEAYPGLPDVQKICDQIQQICLNAIYPPIEFDLETYPADRPGHSLIVLRIGESDATPHHWIANSRIYVRLHDTSKPMNLREEATGDDVIWLLKRREKPTELREVLLARAQARVLKGETLESGHMSIAVVPLYPREKILTRSELVNAVVDLPMPGGYGPRLRTASDAVYISKSQSHPEGHKTQRKYFEVNRYGLYYYAQHCDNSVEYPEWMDIFLAVGKAAYKRYDSVGFAGLIQVRMYVHSRSAAGGGLKLIWKDTQWGDVDEKGTCVDPCMELVREVPCQMLDDDELYVDVFEDMLWSMGRDHTQPTDWINQWIDTRKKAHPTVSFNLPGFGTK